MTNRRAKRSLQNLNLTKGLQTRYMGGWIIVCMVMLLLLNAVVYFQFCSMWNQAVEGAEPFTQASFARGQVVAGLILASCLCAGAIFALAMITAHRVAGPLVGLARTFEEVKKGDYSKRLQFREYDGLDDLATNFNEMMRDLQEKVEVLESQTDTANRLLVHTNEVDTVSRIA